MSNLVIEKLNTVYNLLRDRKITIISEISEKMKCIVCKSLLVNAHQGQCGCNYCEACIDKYIENGLSSCPGDRCECAHNDLSNISIDHKMNLRISKLIAKCPEQKCTYESELIDMDEHLKTCPLSYIDCPFNKIGCDWSHVVRERMREHLQNESYNHNKSVIEAIFELRKEIALIRADEIKALNENSKAIESIKSEIESVKVSVLELADSLAVIRESVVRLGENGMNIREDFSRFELQLQATMTHLNRHLNVFSDGLFTTEIKPGESGSSECFYLKMGSYKMSLHWKQTLNLVQMNQNSSFVNASESSMVKYRPCDNARRSQNSEIHITLFIHRSNNDASLKWPFRSTVSVKLCYGNQFKSATQICTMERPTKNEFVSGDRFTFNNFYLLESSTDIIKCTAAFEML